MSQILDVQKIRKTYDGNHIFAINDVSLSVAKGQICSVVGQSGCGKSTLLRLISGLEIPDKGTISIGGRKVSSKDAYVKPEDRGVGFVFQHFALFPHMTVAQNIAYGIKNLSSEDRVIELLELIKLQAYGDKFPHELSGGEQQRVALARTLGASPSLILLDEPFSSLDTERKQQLRDELFEIIRKAGVSCLFVTHDITDAMMTSDIIAVLKSGNLVQVGSPEKLYISPKNAYVASLFEDINILSQLEVEASGMSYDRSLIYAIRVRDVDIMGTSNAISALIIRKQFLGREKLLHLKLTTGRIIKVICNSAIIDQETNLMISIDPQKILLLEKD